MDNQQIYHKTLTAILKAGREIASDDYMAVALGAVLKSNNKEFPILKNVGIISNGKVSINIDTQINKSDSKDANLALSALFRTITRPFSKEGADSFGKLIASQLDLNTRSELRKIGISI